MFPDLFSWSPIASNWQFPNIPILAGSYLTEIPGYAKNFVLVSEDWLSDAEAGISSAVIKQTKVEVTGHKIGQSSTVYFSKLYYKLTYVCSIQQRQSEKCKPLKNCTFKTTRKSLLFNNSDNSPVFRSFALFAQKSRNVLRFIFMITNFNNNYVATTETETET